MKLALPDIETTRRPVMKTAAASGVGSPSANRPADSRQPTQPLISRRKKNIIPPQERKALAGGSDAGYAPARVFETGTGSTTQMRLYRGGVCLGPSFFPLLFS